MQLSKYITAYFKTTKQQKPSTNFSNNLQQEFVDSFSKAFPIFIVNGGGIWI